MFSHLGPNDSKTWEAIINAHHQQEQQQANTLTCVLNLSAAFLLQLCVVVPLSVFVLVVQNWVLGSFVCYMLPMIQVGMSILK